MIRKNTHWYDYLWIWEIAYFSLGFFNILFAWLGMIDFLLPLAFAILGGNKFYCNHLCGRGQLFNLLGTKGHCSAMRATPSLFVSKWFRYGFLAFFMTMFCLMLFHTYLVFVGANSLQTTLTLLWTFQVPWSWNYTPGIVPVWVAQYAYGFFSVMLTSTIIGLVVMALFKPRSWCAFCPMGTMTQMICKWKARS